MEAFLNERSLHSQFANLGEFMAALATLNTVLTRVAEAPVAKRLYFCPTVFLRPTVGGLVFSACLKQVSEKSIRLQFERLFRERLGAEKWADSRVHDAPAYLWRDENVVDTTLAEHAERRLRERLGMLLTFAGSVFVQGRTVCITKEQEEVILDAVTDANGLDGWYRQHPGLGVVTYDIACQDTPRDHQTILGRRSRFAPTKIVNQGRKVYLDRETDRYWCVDNLHAGQSAHLEVFDLQGFHVCEARLDGSMIPDSRDPIKTLPL